MQNGKTLFLAKNLFLSPKFFFPENSWKNFSLKKQLLHHFTTFATFITFCHLKIFFGEKMPCTKNTSRKQTIWIKESLIVITRSD